MKKYIVLLILLIAAPCWATGFDSCDTYAVPSGGAASGACTLGIECTLDRAYNATAALGDGYTMCLDSGTYTSASGEVLDVDLTQTVYAMMKPAELTRPVLKSTVSTIVRHPSTGGILFDNIDFTMDSAVNTILFFESDFSGELYLRNFDIIVSASAVAAVAYVFLHGYSTADDLTLDTGTITISGHSATTLQVLPLRSFKDFYLHNVDVSVSTTAVDMFPNINFNTTGDLFSAYNSTVTYTANPNANGTIMLGLKAGTGDLSIGAFSFVDCEVDIPYGVGIKAMSLIPATVTVSGNTVDISTEGTSSSAGISLGLDEGAATQLYDNTLDVVMHDNIVRGAGAVGLVSGMHGIGCFLPVSAKIYNNYSSGWDINTVTKGSLTTQTLEFYGNVSANCSPNAASGANYFYGFTGAQIYNNTFFQDANHQTNLDNVVKMGIAALTPMLDTEFVNNVVVGDSGLSLVELNGASSMALSTKNSYYFLDGTVNTAVAAFKISTTTDTSVAEWQALGYDTDSLFADPKLVERTEGSWLLDYDSPAIGAGVEGYTTTVLHPLTDFTNNYILTIPWKYTKNIGAFATFNTLN